MINSIILTIIFAPLIGILLSYIANYFNPKFVQFISIISIGISAIFSTIVFSQFVNHSIVKQEILLYQIFPSPFLNNISFSLNIDQLGIILSFIASVLGLFIAIFSIEYMNHDKHQLRYWLIFQLFISSMNLLVLAGDFLLLFIGWELVGLCSFGLISHYSYKDGIEGKKAAKAGIKALVFTSLADIGILFAIIILYANFNSLSFDIINLHQTSISSSLKSLISVSFIISAFGKSAQFPFIPWLSSTDNIDIDAMQGPTTVSALIHAATMVKAGVYLISRVYLTLTPIDLKQVAFILLLISGTTALIAALSAVVSTDVKRILAYSTVSQLGYMFLSLGIAFRLITNTETSLAFQLAQFHLISHAFFKSLLFLIMGYLIYNAHSRNLFDLQGIANYKTNKILFFPLLFGLCSLVGIPPFGGFFSKDSIIYLSFDLINKQNSFISYFTFLCAFLTAIVTAIYSTRIFYYLTIKSPSKKFDNNGKVMKGVLIILSLFTLFGGFFKLTLNELFPTVETSNEIEVVFTLVNTVIIISVVFLSTYLLIRKQNWLENMRNNDFIAFILSIFQNGFYLESIWQNSWNIIRKFSFQFRRIHTGDLNTTMLFIAIGSFVIIIILFGGI